MATCTYCKTDNSIPLFDTLDQFENTYTIHKCQDCSCHFLSPFPSAELLNEAYESDYYGLGEEKFKVGMIELILEFFRKKRASYLVGLVSERGRVLDIGCGNGALLNHLGSSGKFDLHGLELTENSAKRALKNPEISIKIGPLQIDDYEKNSFDLITSSHVFEHVSDPKNHLEIISKIIKKDGIVFFAFPNIDSWQAKLFKGNWLHLDAPRHLHFFQPTVFIKLLESHGFELVKVSHHHFEYNPFGWVQSFLNLVLKKREVLYEALKGNEAYVTKFSSKSSVFLQKVFLLCSLPVFTIISWIEEVFKKGATVEFVFKKR